MDDSYNRRINHQLNVLNRPLLSCNCNKTLIERIKLTGIYRDGYCKTEKNDFGLHTVCSIMTDEFLEFSKSVGNNLSDPVPEYNFLGVSHGDRWCLCVTRWIEAEKAGKAPKIILEATHEKTLEYTSLHLLVKYAYKD